MRLSEVFNIFEAPIEDFQLVGNWGDKEKSNSFRHKTDRAILQNEKAVQKIKNKFLKVDHPFNFYFVNSPGAGKHSERREIELKDLPLYFKPKVAEELRTAIDLNDSDNTSIIFVTNNGVNRKQLSAWIIAHRIGHAIFDTVGWRELDRDVTGMFRVIIENAYGVTLVRADMFFSSRGKELAKFFQDIGTMKSARDKNLGGRPYEFYFEMFAQYLLTGKVTFNDLPKVAFGRRLQDDDSDLLHQVADSMEYYFDAALGAVYGKTFIM